jgi:mono/diheme cytochrome c family protein
VQGIEGTPMPAVALKPDNPQGLSEDEVWQLVAYILNMKSESIEVSSAAENVAAKSSVEESNP